MGRRRNAVGEEELSRRGGGERSGLLFNKTRPPHWLLSLSPRPSRPGLLNNVKAIYLLNSLTLTDCLKCTNFNPTMKASDWTIFWPLASVFIVKRKGTYTQVSWWSPENQCLRNVKNKIRMLFLISLLTLALQSLQETDSRWSCLLAVVWTCEGCCLHSRHTFHTSWQLDRL